jgi:hemerythrin-like domain-containing protein
MRLPLTSVSTHPISPVMEQLANLRELLRMAAEDHAAINAGMDSFRRMLTGDLPQDASREFDDLKFLFRDKLPRHFAYEEQKIFPLLVADNPSKEVSRLILELKEEHQRLLVDVRWLNLELSSLSQMQSVGEARTECFDFFNRLKDHASKEDELFRLVS